MGTRQEWVTDFLVRGGYPTTVDNVRACLAWCRSEFGGQSPVGAAFNLYATTLDAPGATLFNDVGVKNYPDWSTGVDACASTLAEDQAGYQQIRDHLVAGQDPSATCAAISASVWGSHPSDAILAEVDADPANNADLWVGDRTGGDLPPGPPPPPPEEDMPLNDDDKRTITDIVQGQLQGALSQLIGPHPWGTENVLGTWMQEQTANAIAAIDAKVDAAVAAIEAAKTTPPATP